MKALLTVLKTIGFLILGGLLLWLTFKNQDIDLIQSKLKHAHFFWLFLSIICSVLALLSRALRWKQLIQPLGYSPRLFTVFNSIMFGYLANMALPRLGEISRCGSLSKKEDIPFEKLIGTVIIERLADVVMLLLCIGIVLIIEFERLGGFLIDEIGTPLYNKLATSPTLILIVLLFVVGGAVTLYMILKAKQPPSFIIKIRQLLKGIMQGVSSVGKMKNKGLFIAHSLFIWVMYFLMTYVCFFALDATAEGLDAGAGLFLMVLGGIGMTAPVQGGIGTYHLLVSKGMELYQISATDGIVFAIMAHATQTVLLIILGGFSMVALFFLTKPRPSQNEVASIKN